MVHEQHRSHRVNDGKLFTFTIGGQPRRHPVRRRRRPPPGDLLDIGDRALPDPFAFQQQRRTIGIRGRKPRCGHLDRIVTLMGDTPPGDRVRVGFEVQAERYVGRSGSKTDVDDARPLPSGVHRPGRPSAGVAVTRATVQPWLRLHERASTLPRLDQPLHPQRRQRTRRRRPRHPPLLADHPLRRHLITRREFAADDLVAQMVRDLQILRRRLLNLGRHRGLLQVHRLAVDIATMTVAVRHRHSLDPMNSTRCRRLLIAAGGGGDAIAAAIIHRQLCGNDHQPNIATYSWDRLIVDPVPGPRDPSWFHHTEPVGQHTVAITPASTVRPPGNSLLPRLSADLATPLYLLDPRGGAVGMRRQLTELVGILDVEHVHLVDVGGDILARGDEPELRSPLADTLTLTAAYNIGAPVDVFVTGAGLDGELDADHVNRIVDDLHGHHAWLTLTADTVQPYRPILDWHPSEATGLLITAALGFHGTVEIRDAGLTVKLTPASCAVHRCRPDSILAHNQFAACMTSATNLRQAENAVEKEGRDSELRHERAKASSRIPVRKAKNTPTSDLVRELDQYCKAAQKRGVDALTLRRAAELLDVEYLDILSIAAVLNDRIYSRLAPSIIRTGTHF